MKMHGRVSRKATQLLIILCAVISFASALQLEGLSTKKPRTTKFSSKVVLSSEAPPSLSIYRLNTTSKSKATCILIQTDGILEINYRSATHEDIVKPIFLPDNPELSGDCEEEDISNIALDFKGFKLFFEFRKTPGGERWYINNVQLTYSSSNPLLEHVDRPGLQVKLTPKHTTLLFPTPVGKSYTCNEQNITLISRDENDRAGHWAKLLLRDIRMQSFMYKAASTWGPSYQCSLTGTYRDESAPLFVGTTLAIFALGSVGAYGIWRYLKIKKVQYGNME